MKTTTAAAAAAIAAAALTSAATGAHASAFPACRAGQLRVTVKLARAAMSNAGLTLTATNEGPACVLSGFPVVKLEGPRGGVLPARVKDIRTDFFGQGAKPGTALVLHQLAAHAELDLSTAAGPGAAVGYARVTVPGGQDRAQVPAGPAFTGQQATVTAWTLPKTQ